jgi:hypothetical protein
MRSAMKRTSAVVATVALTVLAGATAGSASDTDINGPLAPDQSTPTVNTAVQVPMVPVPVEVVTTSPAFHYSMVVADTDELDSPNPVEVVTSTPAGSAAVTGVVTRADTGAGVGGARVTLQPTGGTITQASVAISGVGGVFAFTDIPTDPGGTSYNLTIADPTYGTYTLASDVYEPDTTYELTAPLSADAQWFNESSNAADAAMSAVSSTSGYAATHRVPPTIMVGRYGQTNSCASDGNHIDNRRYPWRFYVLHVAVAEIDTRWHESAWKANAAVEQNYAWAKNRNPDSSSYDVTNTTSDQCFKPEKKVPTNSWRTWIGDVLDERITNSSDGLPATPYRAGSYSCSESTYPANGNLLSQNGSRALDDNCGYSSWRSIVQYYFSYTVDDGSIPPRPDTSATPGSNAVTLHFPSRVSGSSDNVAWHYSDDVKIGGNWVTIYDAGWDSNSRSVPTSYTYKTTACHEYRANASNPVGTSQYSTFGTVCPS